MCMWCTSASCGRVEYYNNKYSLERFLFISFICSHGHRGGNSGRLAMHKTRTCLCSCAPKGLRWPGVHIQDHVTENQRLILYLFCLSPPPVNLSPRMLCVATVMLGGGGVWARLRSQRSVCWSAHWTPRRFFVTPSCPASGQSQSLVSSFYLSFLGLNFFPRHSKRWRLHESPGDLSTQLNYLRSLLSSRRAEESSSV